MSRLCSSLTCVVLPLLSRPSSTTNAPRAAAGVAASLAVPTTGFVAEGALESGGADAPVAAPAVAGSLAVAMVGRR